MGQTLRGIDKLRYTTATATEMSIYSVSENVTKTKLHLKKYFSNPLFKWRSIYIFNKWTTPRLATKIFSIFKYCNGTFKILNLYKIFAMN